MQQALFGRMLVEPEVMRMLLFGLALVLMMLFRPAGCCLRRCAGASCDGARHARMTPDASLLGAERLGKRFGGVQALTEVAFVDRARARSTA